MESRGATRAEPPATGELLSPHPVTAALETCDLDLIEQVAPVVDGLAVTLESHLEAILGRLRPGAEPTAVLEDFRAIVAACRERGIPVEVEIPLASENASTLPETIAFAGEEGAARVRVVPYRGRAAAGRGIDPFLSFSDRYLARIERLSAEAAQVAGVTFVWEPRAGRSFAPARLPGFCEDAWGRVKVSADGIVAPCAYAEEGELELGRIGPGRSLQDVWEGAAASDLRRAHLTGDLPAPCTMCPRTLGPDLPDTLPFLERFMAETVGERGVREVLRPLAPGPVARCSEPPRLQVRLPALEVDSWWLALAPGGERERLSALEVAGRIEQGRRVQIAFPREVWLAMSPNVGYWWALFGQTRHGSWVCMRAPRCLVRHEGRGRVPGTTLHYPDSNAAAPVEPGPRATGFLASDYDELVERVRAAVVGALPAGAVCAMATKGDERLLDLGEVEGWHFPCATDHSYAGFNPPDGRWTVDQLEALRAAGAGYFVLPATAFWWREHYRELASWLRLHATLVLEERDTCLILSLAEPRTAGEAA